MPKTKRGGKRLRSSVDCRLHQTHQDRSDASIASTHRRFAVAVPWVSHDPSARRHRLKWALAGSTALVAVALAGTLLVAVTPVFAEGGDGGANAGTSPGGGGGIDNPTGPGPNGGTSGYTGGGGGGGAAGITGGTGGNSIGNVGNTGGGGHGC